MTNYHWPERVSGVYLQYMRNRCYDPASGRFTQADSIGLAGGINQYNYASADPINYWDPFGLCPESMRDEEGKCPGGLSVDQWNKVEHSANNSMTSNARRETLRLRRDGKISPWVGLDEDGVQRVGATGAVVKSSPGTVRINANFSGLMAESVLHEVKHTIQFRGLSAARLDAAFKNFAALDSEAEIWARSNVCAIINGVCQ